MDIAVLDDYVGAAANVADWSRLQDQGRVVFFADHVADEAALVELLEPFQAVVLMRERTSFPEAVIRQLADLRLIVTTGRRNASLDLEAARTHHVTVCNTDSPAGSTVELTLSLLLGLRRNLVTEAVNVAAGRWQSTLGTDLSGSTLGVVGFGRIGARVAEIARAFDMRVLAWSRSLNAELAEQAQVEATPLEDLLSRADAVSVHLPLTEQTRGLLGRQELALMKPGAVLINTSRGPIVDATALREALLAGRLAGAGVDVYDVEPLPADDPLRGTPGLLATPHIGYVTRGVMEVFYRQAVEDLEAFIAGSPIRVVTAPG